MFSNNLGFVSKLYWLANKIVNYLRAKVESGAVRNSVKDKIMIWISADQILVIVAKG